LPTSFGLIGLVDRGLQMLALADEFAAHIDVAGMRAHCEARDQAAFDQQMRIVRMISRSLQVPGSDSSRH